ncbi:MAG TPA: IS30 family transposase [Candidatus Paceibacterota bacterium]|jgi:IS30 family transposase|nr:IS30 family transposase [Candidatus Paceibacterota bacterium]HPN89715.1 IS30 family transposase [Candidatus Paceibacterota bacterium]
MAKIKNKYKHLSLAERYVIEKLLLASITIRGIALILGRSPSTISNEIKRNSVKGQYIAKKAAHKSYVKRKYSKTQSLKVVMDMFLYRFVEEKLNKKWSPEQMSGYLKRQNITVSTKAIYKFIGSRGWEYKLFWSRHNKKSGRKQYRYGNPIDGRKYIELRPEVTEPGHYEMDFIVSKQSPRVLLVIVDRFLKKSWLIKLPNRKHATICDALRQTFSGQPLLSLTTDNDIAFLKWQNIEELLNVSIYFCHPYHSWEKGLVENTNRWIRCFIAKRRDIGSVTQEELAEIHTFLNDRPRRCLGYFTANELELNYQSVFGLRG